MTRMIITGAVVVLLAVSVGCQSNSDSQRIPRRPINLQTEYQGENVALMSNEADLAEKVRFHSQEYQRYLELLLSYYMSVGDNMKIQWSEKELKALTAMPQYRYIIDAVVAPASLRATTQIPEADVIYARAVEIQRQAGPLIVLKDDEELRKALTLYNQLINLYPTSDKIDDAAYKAAGIYEYFQDYSIALIYYQRTYQWDSTTPHAARFHAADILDKKLFRRTEALELFQEAVKKEAGYTDWVEYANKRIKELTKSD